MRSRLHRTEQGSNQYEAKRRVLGFRYNQWVSILWTLAIATLFIYVAQLGKVDATVDNVGYISPLATFKGPLDEYGLPVLDDSQEMTWDKFIQQAYEVAPIYDYPVKVLIAQAALESAKGTSEFAKERNNYFGYSCYDSDPRKYCARFDNPKQSMIEYMRLIKNSYQEAYANRKNPELMVKLIKKQGYATDPEYVGKVLRVMKGLN